MAIQAVFKCVLCCSQTSLVVQDVCERRLCVCVSERYNQYILDDTDLLHLIACVIFNRL